MQSIFEILQKNFQDDQLNSRRFPGGFLNSSRFPGFPGVVDHDLTNPHIIFGGYNDDKG